MLIILLFERSTTDEGYLQSYKYLLFMMKFLDLAYPIMGAIDNHSHLHYLYSMFVCICKQVTDGQIKEAVTNGACSFKDVQSELGVATQCGECKNHARQCMRDCRSQCENSIFATSSKSSELIASA